MSFEVTGDSPTGANGHASEAAEVTEATATAEEAATTADSSTAATVEATTPPTAPATVTTTPTADAMATTTTTAAAAGATQDERLPEPSGTSADILEASNGHGAIRAEMTESATTKAATVTTAAAGTATTAAAATVPAIIPDEPPTPQQPQHGQARNATTATPIPDEPPTTTTTMVAATTAPTTTTVPDEPQQQQQLPTPSTEARERREASNGHSSPSPDTSAYEAQLLSATQQIGRLQARIDELEVECNTSASNATALEEELERVKHQLRLQKKAEDGSKACLIEAQTASKALERQVEELRKEVQNAKEVARRQAAKESGATLDQVRDEMEKELAELLKKKDDQVAELKNKLSNSENVRKELARDFDQATSEVEALEKKVNKLEQDGAGRNSDHERTLEALVADHKRQVEASAEQKELEERQKHELALNLRSVEERARTEIEQLEAQKAQLELQFSALQVQLQEEQQKCVDLSVSLGEAQHQFSQLHETTEGWVDAGGEEARRLAAAEAIELRQKLHDAEDKLIEAQSMRDMFSKETDMYRSELKVTKEERQRIEDELTKLQEQSRDASSTASSPSVAGQEAVMEALQKDFDSRMERYRDEVQYLRQKCDEKEKRCERLMAEKSSLMVELRSSGVGAAGSWRSPAEDTEAAAAIDLEAGDVSAAKVAVKANGTGTRSAIRSLPLAAPGWLRSADEPLRLVVRTFATVPYARLIFFSYFILLHAWVLFVMQQMAIK
eukprot:TRINITY_DN16873_c2_g1_i1.p1 TRINITY_DN16873_c2_g1~~TRINITY_DN16873_c2_g1_i1.p1  ORF type:complete len:839 (+),score=277.16 TRINITY_DN16873_c2_g1_i1:312-2519(+)